MLSFDVESLPIAPGRLAPRLVCVSIARPGLPPELYTADEGVAVLSQELLAGETFIGHNIAYDFAVVCAYAPALLPLVFKAYAEGRVFCTQTRQELLDIAQGRIQSGGGTLVFRGRQWVKADYTLAGSPKVKGSTGLVGLYLGKDRSAEKGPDAWRLRYNELEGVPLKDWPAEARDYAIADAADTLAVFQHQPVPADEQTQVRGAWALHLIACWGLRCDPVAVAALETRLLAEQKANRRRLVQVGFLKLRKCRRAKGVLEDAEEHVDGVPHRYSKDTKAIKAYVERAYRLVGLDAPKTETGAVSMEKDALGESGSRLLRLLADGGGVSKVIETYLPFLKQGAAVPINTRYGLVNSGRTSSSRPNIQNLPTGRRCAGTRETFVPRPGHYFVSVDFDSFEMAALAHVCFQLFGASKMADAIRAKRDLHLEVAAVILRLPYDDCAARYAAGDKVVKNARDAAKVANFGFMGGLGPDALVKFARKTYGVRLTRAEAVTLKTQWFAAWPEMRRYFAFINDQVGLGDATITTVGGGLVRGGVDYCAAANHHVQGTAARAAKVALFNVAWEQYVDKGTALFGSRNVAFVHDEAFAEVPIENAHAASYRLAEVMTTSAATVITSVPVTASPALMERWYKNAKTVHNAAGQLVPWAPPT